MDVSITEAFIGAGFTTANNEKLGVCMRDTGFEVSYIVGGKILWVEFKEGNFRVMSATIEDMVNVAFQQPNNQPR